MNQTITCNDTINSSISNLSCATQSVDPPNNPFALFLKVAFGSSIYMIVVAFITVVANSLLLLVFYVDPYKTFRNPTSYFLIGLTFVDLITGLVQEPIFASCFILGYLGHPAKRHCPKLFQIGYILSLVTMNASFIIVFAFTATQLIVITSPLKYASLVTKKIVVVTLLVIYGYTITFGLLDLVKLPDPDTFRKVDLFFHSFFMIYLSITCYILLYRAFRRKMASSKSLRSESVFQGKRPSSNRVERKFVAVNFLLIILLFFCTQPSAILVVLTHYWSGADNTTILIPNLIVDNIIYLKFMLDPFVYAWRLPKYRRSLKMVLCCGSREHDSESTLSSQVVARMTKSTETVVTLNFRSISSE